MSRFYRAAITVPLNSFRDAALRDLATVIPFDAALWATGASQPTRLHSLTLLGLDERFARALASKPDLDPVWAEIGDDQLNPVDVAELIPAARLASSAIDTCICRPFGLRRALGVRYRDSRSNLDTLIVLFRFDRGERFNAEQRRAQRHLTFHLLNATSLAYSVYLSALGEYGLDKSAAICDRFGVCYDAQPGFMALLSEKFPEWSGERLPFELPDGTQRNSLDARSLQVLTEPAGDLICVRIRRRGPMDLLTGRERQIVESVCRGLSYKEVARPLGIAPSTVSNHLYRVFDKLGVNSRTELAKLAGRWPQLH